MIKILRRLILTVALLVAPAAAITALPATHAGATSPLGCWTDTYWHTILCYQIIGPNGTDKVNTFNYSEYNVGTRVQWIDVEVSGPSGLWGPVLDIVYPHRYQPGGIYMYRYVLPGNYCIHFFSRYHVAGKCWSVHAF